MCRTQTWHRLLPPCCKLTPFKAKTQEQKCTGAFLSLGGGHSCCHPIAKANPMAGLSIQRWGEWTPPFSKRRCTVMAGGWEFRG